MLRYCVAVLVGLAGCVSAAFADPQPIPEDIARAIARLLCEKADKAEAPIKIAGDPEKAMGLHEPEVAAAMVVPRTELKADNLPGVEKQDGEPAGYLFLYKIAPVVSGKVMAVDKLPTVLLKTDDGVERTVIVLRLALRKEGEQDWKLLVFGSDKKPLVTSKFRAEANNSTLPLSLGTKDIEGDQGTLIVTVFGKYAADLRMGKAEE
ncbi:MAG: hypothetical protein NZM31_02795 [Gemmatales bacterium]|nr:hypothetical protein [Gemmatales bacterium]MDW8385928.1 hypothetical protein [Gemmatales bacterium]